MSTTKTSAPATSNTNVSAPADGAIHIGAPRALRMLSNTADYDLYEEEELQPDPTYVWDELFGPWSDGPR